ncbi:MAG: acyl-CoA dehydratase activase [Gracilibacteraceae bacterium]|nr:acyl-CoA dehydratase activase [Gracilibacteraceae bacterium]
MLTGGIDIGSTMTKAVVMRDGEIAGSEITVTGAEHRRTAHLVMAAVLERVGLKLDDLDFIVGTGYGRLNIPFADRQITEITCHARGIGSLFPQAQTVIEIGGQDCKCIRVRDGKVTDFAMNEKCAAGTGRFLQIAADMMELTLDKMNELALNAREMVPISNYCAIFAQQEIISDLSLDIPADVILAGLFDSFARRLLKMAASLKVVREVVLTGGGSKHRALRAAVENILGYPVRLPAEPLLTGAYGAALLAAEQVQRAGRAGGTRKFAEVSVG